MMTVDDKVIGETPVVHAGARNRKVSSPGPWEAESAIGRGYVEA